jgi:hypothetical protein
MLELSHEMTFVERIEGPLGPTTGSPDRGSVFLDALESGAETAFTDQYMCMAPQFEVDRSDYDWLTQSLFIARGRLAGPKRVEYEIYRVV